MDCPSGCPHGYAEACSWLKSPNAGIYEPRELAGSAVLDKLAARVAPPSVKRHRAEQEADRRQAEQAQAPQAQEEDEAA